MRKLIVFLMSMACCFSLQAGQSVNDMNETVQVANEKVEKLRKDALGEVYDVMIKCELDFICVDDGLQALQKETMNPVLDIMIDHIRDEYKEEIAWLREDPKACDIEDLKATNKVMASCMGHIKQGLMEENTENLIDGLICMLGNLEPLADENNLFAMAVMLDIFELAGQEKMVSLYKFLMDAKKDDPNYPMVKKCMVNWL